MQDKIYDFWVNNALHNIKPSVGGEFPEGWDVIQFFKDLYTPQKYGETIEIGCGYGRLCTAFDPRAYLGLDISSEAIKEANSKNSEYTFEVITKAKLNKFYPHSRTKLLYTVLLHQSDEDIEAALKNLCETTRRIIVAEVCGRDWRDGASPWVFNRSPEEYEIMFQNHGRGLSRLIKKPYKRYKNWDKWDTDLSIMVFED